MEIGMLPLLAPLMQTQSGLGVSNGSPQVGFAGILAMLQQDEGFEPAQAMLNLQLANGDEQMSLLPYLLLAMLPELTGQQGQQGQQVAEALGEDEEQMMEQAALLPLMQQMIMQLPKGEEGQPSAPELQVEQTAESASGEQLLAATAQGADLSAEKVQTESLPEEEQVTGERQAKNAPIGIDFAAAEPANAAESAKESADGVERRLAAGLGSQQKRSEQESPAGQPQQSFTDQDPFRTLLQTTATQAHKVQPTRSAVVEQVLEKMVLLKDGEGESTLFVRLRPAVLGEVAIRLRMDEGRLIANILTENVQVKEALDGAMAQLRQRLEAQQINVAEMTVTVNQEQNFSGGGGFQQLWQNPSESGGLSVSEGVEEFTPAATAIPGVLDMRA